MIAKRGVDLAYCDMLPEGGAFGDRSPPRGLPLALRRRSSSKPPISARANPRFYPVFITTFKCSPDSFALEWFRRILDARGQALPRPPDRRARFERRLRDARRGRAPVFPEPLPAARAAPHPAPPPRPEAEVRASPIIPRLSTELRGKMVLFPNWDPLVCSLLAANLRGNGIDARALEESPDLHPPRDERQSRTVHPHQHHRRQEP